MTDRFQPTPPDAIDDQPAPTKVRETLLPELPKVTGGGIIRSPLDLLSPKFLQALVDWGNSQPAIKPDDDHLLGW